MSGDIVVYQEKVTSEHRDKPKFMAMVGAVAQPIADNIALAASISAKYDIDVAVGQQLDRIGLWVGVGRQLAVPLASVFFSFDTEGLGFDEGVWDGSSSGSEIIVLDDDAYRILLRAKILNNHWDGSIPHAYEIWDTAFAGTGYTLFIVDHGDLSMTLGLLFDGDTIDAVVLALFTGGYLNVKPAGVRIRDYIVASARPPIFALDEEGSSFAGLDEGSWAESVVEA